MRHRFSKLLFSIMLIVCMIVSCAGCKKEKESQVNDTTQLTINEVNNDAVNGVDTNTNQQNNDYGKGRFIEKVYTLPETAFINFSLLSEQNSEKVPGKITFTCWQNNYSYDEEKGEWNIQDTEWEENNRIIHRQITIGEDGKEYYLCTEYLEDNSLLRHLYIKDGDSLQPVTMDSLDENINTRNNYGELDPIVKYMITEDGDIILGFEDHLSYIRKKGKSDQITQVVGSGIEIVDNKLYALDTALENIDIYDLSNWNLVDSIPANDLFNINENYYRCTAMTKDSDGNIYLQNSKGIFQLSKGATSFTLLIDGALNNIGSGCELSWSLSIDDTGRFYNIRCDSDVSVWTLYTYEYDPEISSLPGKELTIYSYYDLPAVRAAIPEFQNEHPDIYVNYIVQTDGSEEYLTINDSLKNLNTQLLTGGGPDIIFLDQFNFNDFADHGILVDLTEQIESDPDIFDFIKHTFVKDGKIYAIPSRVQIPLFTGTAETLESTKSLQELTDYANSSDTYIFAGVSDWEIITYLYTCYRDELFNEDHSINTDKIKAMIENIKIIADHSQIENTDLGMNSIFNVKSGYSALGIGRIYDISSIQVILNGLDYTDTKMSSINNSYTPNDNLSININSKMKQEALDFMHIMLSDKIQLEDFVGVSVKRNLVPNPALYENVMGRAGIKMTICTDVGKQDIEIPWPTREQAQSYVPIYDELTNPYIYDDALDTTILKSIYQYYNGEATIDEIMTNMSSFLMIYTTE